MTNNSTYRTVPKKNRQNPNKTVQLNNQIPKGENTENATPDYLPYSVYSNLEQLQQKAQEEFIHPVGNSLTESQRQPSQKPRKRHSRPLNLTGEVNLGTNTFNRREREKKHRRKPVNGLEETVTNSGRHHHHNILNEIETTEAPVSTSTSTSTQAPTELPILETTQSTVDKSLMLAEKKQLDEKAMRRDRLRAKLAKLTPEEREAFILMKQQRAEAKKRSLNLTN